ncbi:putative serine/threonine-protein kinase SgK494 [Channa argus]|uniref:Putative serine/threonine-protein kinase SgK494 n=1 Tax=Channa argus TaxID=215402 RepID=A0A6G1PRJ2_CHAAH|nr:putative serine/threonine-protein kinase SgK494 [Channa argus]
MPIPRLLLPLRDSEGTPQTFISAFLPEFPHRTFPGRDNFQILGFITKGSYGPIWKVKDLLKEKTYAVKRQLKHPFIHNLQDCWQTQRHLFIMCDYCSTGDLHTYWLLKGRLREDEVRVFAAELGSFLHDLGIIHRDVKFPVPAESDHSTMLKKVREFPYILPNTFSSALILHLTELLSKNPVNRLRNLDSFQMQAFFRGISFDPHVLQKTTVDFILELRNHPDWAAKSMRGLSLDCFDPFDCDEILHSSTPIELSPTLVNMDLSQATEQTCEA